MSNVIIIVLEGISPQSYFISFMAKLIQQSYNQNTSIDIDTQIPYSPAHDGIVPFNPASPKLMVGCNEVT